MKKSTKKLILVLSLMGAGSVAFVAGKEDVALAFGGATVGAAVASVKDEAE